MTEPELGQPPSPEGRRGRRILVVNDDPHTRLTLEQALEALGHDIVLAASGAEAIAALADPKIDLVLLDLKMPDVGGLEVLQHVERERPGLRVVILTAHGTVDSAVESMKLGALDLIQKPFSVEEIRSLVQGEMDVAERRSLVDEDYIEQVERAREKIRRRDFDGALEHLRRAIARRDDRPEAHNLMGVIEEVRGDRPAAQRHWRVALLLDPRYTPAQDNLHRSVARSGGAPDLG